MRTSGVIPASESEAKPGLPVKRSRVRPTMALLKPP